MRMAYISPLTNDVNRFTDILAEDMRTLGFGVGDLKQALIGDWSVQRRQKVLLLNWYEDRLAWANRPGFELVRSILVLVVLKIRIGQIVWIRHNMVPHDASDHGGVLYAFFIQFIGLLSNTSVALRPHPEVDHVVPHPLYNSGQLEPTTRQYRFVLFGSVRASKGIVDILQWWPRDRRLLIFGRCGDQRLAREIKEIIEARELDAEHHNRFLPDAELNQWLLTSTHAVIPHGRSGALVSGTFYHAAGLGMNILLTPGDYFDYVAAQYSFVSPLAQDSEPTNIDQAQVVREILATNNTTFGA